jgi:hypothetical protein
MSSQTDDTPLTTPFTAIDDAVSQSRRSRVQLVILSVCVVAVVGVVASVGFVHMSRHESTRANVRGEQLLGGDHVPFIDCGGLSLCGIITLETGDGSGYYKHEDPSLHGLWPQVNPYGNSQCIPPKDNTNPASIPSCYNTKESKDDPEHQLEFVVHEWTKHGACAGPADSGDFFTQACGLSSKPLALMASEKASGSDLDATADALKAAGYPVVEVDHSDSQIMISACAKLNADGETYTWYVAALHEFSHVCGDGTGPVPSSSPDPSSVPLVCEPSTRGPPCTADADCLQLVGCVRCAHSGYCTSQD